MPTKYFNKGKHPLPILPFFRDIFIKKMKNRKLLFQNFVHSVKSCTLEFTFEISSENSLKYKTT
jgi:hypothetical protein